MKATILVRIKDDILDAPGRAVAQRLKEIGFPEVVGAKLGKVIELEIEGIDRESLTGRIEKMCRQLLVNSVVEEFQVISVE